MGAAARRPANSRSLQEAEPIGEAVAERPVSGSEQEREAMGAAARRPANSRSLQEAEPIGEAVARAARER